MANEQNLIPFNKRTTREASEAGKKGAVITNNKRREKKTLAEILCVLDKGFIKQKIEAIKHNSKISAEKKKQYIELLEKSDNVLLFEMYQIAMSNSVPAVKVRAIENILDRIYGKPKQEIQSSGESNISISWEK